MCSNFLSKKTVFCTVIVLHVLKNILSLYGHKKYSSKRQRDKIFSMFYDKPLDKWENILFLGVPILSRNSKPHRAFPSNREDDILHHLAYFRLIGGRIYVTRKSLHNGLFSNPCHNFLETWQNINKRIKKTQNRPIISN